MSLVEDLLVVSWSYKSPSIEFSFLTIELFNFLNIKQ